MLLKGVSRETILAACENVDVGQVIIGLLRSRREQSRIEALYFIFDRDLGLSGGIVHTHVRDPFLASVPKEALDELLRANIISDHKWLLLLLDTTQNTIKVTDIATTPKPFKQYPQ